MPISCPAAQQSVTTRNLPPRVVCVTGTISDSLRAKQPPQAQAQAPTPSAAAAAADVYVMVYGGHNVPISPTVPAGAPQAAVDGQDWEICIGVGDLGASGTHLVGAPLTAVAWQCQTGTMNVESISSVEFFGVVEGVAGAGECCDCASGAGRGDEELDAAAELDVVVPDGAAAGAYTARASAQREWTMSVGKDAYTIRYGCCKLEVTGPSAAAASKAVETSPFSATFPGSVFGAEGDVVVTVA